MKAQTTPLPGGGFDAGPLRQAARWRVSEFAFWLIPIDVAGWLRIRSSEPGVAGS